MPQQTRSSSQRIFGAEEVLHRLQPYMQFLADLPARAVERYAKEVAPKFSNPSKRTRASAIHDFMIAEATKEFGPAMVYTRSRWIWRAAPGLVVQFKKLNDRGVPMNYPTPAAREFQTQKVIPNFPSGMRLTLGYTLNDTATGVIEVRVLAQDGHRVILSREITGLQAIMPIFAAPAAPAAAPERQPRRLHAKESATTRSEKSKKKT